MPGGPDDTVSQADVEPQSAPGAPGISEEALDTNRVFSVLGQHARNLENASDADTARESLGEFVAAFEAGTAELPADLVGRLRDHVVIAQQAIEGREPRGGESGRTVDDRRDARGRAGGRAGLTRTPVQP